MATKKVRKWYAFLMTCLFSVKFVQMKVFIRLGASENEQYSISLVGALYTTWFRRGKKTKRKFERKA